MGESLALTQLIYVLYINKQAYSRYIALSALAYYRIVTPRSCLSKQKTLRAD